MDPAQLFRQDPDPLVLNAGDVLFREGDHGHEMFVLLEGSVDVRVGQRLVESAGPGALLGELALIDEGSRTATVTATSTCRLARVDQKRFHFMIQHNPYFATHVMKELVARLRHMNRLISQPNP